MTKQLSDIKHFELQTERLTLRYLSTNDADFILRLTNQPSFLEFIGDKGVRNLDDARHYILSGPVASYIEHGFGLYLTAQKDGTPVGICGLVSRPGLDDPDIGFAFLPEYWGKGYATESGHEVLRHAREQLGIKRVLAVTDLRNDSSARVLNRLGLVHERDIELPDHDELSRLFVPKSEN